MSAANKIEIKLITDYREFLLGKIETLKNSVNQVATSFGDDISSSVDEFSKIIYTKLKIIDERFAKQADELESLRAELLSKKFDESNFNNVSMIRTLDKTIKERDLKIKELESRIRFLEGNTASGASASASASSAKKKLAPAIATEKEVNNVEPVPPVLPVPIAVPVVEPVVESLAVVSENINKLNDAPRVVDSDGDVVIAVSAKRTRTKTDKKKAEPVSSVMSEVSSVPEEQVIMEDKPKKPIRKIKKASKVEKEEETKVEPVVSEPSQDANDAIEAQRLADEEALRQAAEEAAEAERIEEAQRLEEAERLALEAEQLALEAEQKAEAERIELEKKKKTEVVKKPVIGKKEPKEASKKITSKTTSTTSTTPLQITTTSALDVGLSQHTNSKEAHKEIPTAKMEYPDKMPELEDLDVITVSGNDYYCDKNNNAVYQMVNGDDVGVFMGYYDSELETITPVDA